MSYIKKALEDAPVAETTMWDVTMMYVEHVIKTSKKVQFFDGEEWVDNTAFSHFDCQKSAMFSLGADKIEILSEGDDFIVIHDHFERNEKYKVLKFIL